MAESLATITLQGITPYSQSRQPLVPRLEGESPDDFDKRTWRFKQTTVRLKDGREVVAAPWFGVHCSIVDASKYTGERIKGAGMKAWQEKFRSGLIFDGDIPMPEVDPQQTDFIDIWAHVDGVRGSGKRVPRRFPIIPAGWVLKFDLWILDPIITERKLRETIRAAGLFIGIGRGRPQMRGANGRFKLADLVWQDNREFLA